MDVNLIKVNKGELLTLENPDYHSVIAKYSHLKSVRMRDCDKPKPRLPVHVVLGAGKYARIKTENRPLIGKDGEPVAGLTKLGWFIYVSWARIRPERNDVNSDEPSAVRRALPH